MWWGWHRGKDGWVHLVTADDLGQCARELREYIGYPVPNLDLCLTAPGCCPRDFPGRPFEAGAGDGAEGPIRRRR